MGIIHRFHYYSEFVFLTLRSLKQLFRFEIRIVVLWIEPSLVDGPMY